MASKGQKFKKYDPKIKDQILKEYFSGNESPTSLSFKYDLSVATI